MVGVVLGGESIVGEEQEEFATGGMICGGLTTINVVYNSATVGGAFIGGEGIEEISLLGHGGAIVGGLAEIDVIYNISVDSGVVLGGVAVFTYTEEASGGVVLGGIGHPAYGEFAVGGEFVAGGVAAEEFLKQYDVGIGGIFTSGYSVGEEVYYYNRKVPNKGSRLSISGLRVDSNGKQKYIDQDGAEYFEKELISAAQLHRNLGDFFDSIDDLEEKIDSAIVVPYSGPRATTVTNPNSDDFPLSGLSPLVSPNAPTPSGGVVSLALEGENLKLSGISSLSPTSVSVVGGTTIISGPSSGSTKLSGIKELEPENIPAPIGHKILVKR